MNNEFLKRVNEYFGIESNEYLKLLKNSCTQSFFLNTKKGSKEDILNLIDFDYFESSLTKNSFYHNCDNIGKTKAFELGLIYPQDIASSLSSTFISVNNIKTVADMCAAPGGKTINVLNKLNDDVLLIANDVNHTRSTILSSNLERLGLSNVIITNKDTSDLSKQLENFADLVILDAPCSGEGMIRKYPEILDEYSNDNIKTLSSLQSKLLEDAYRILKGNGQLLYSTCTYSFEEDEEQISNFLAKHSDMILVNLGDNKYSKLKGTLKYSPLNNTEGQFIALMVKEDNSLINSFKLLKPIKEQIVDEFIKKNISISNYYLYKHYDKYYLSLIPLYDLGYNVLKYGIYIGDIVNNRFEPSHSLYRSNILKNHFNFIYELNDVEYNDFVKGYEIKTNLENNYYLLTYKDFSIGYGKCSNNIIKNKYPKGLRRK